MAHTTLNSASQQGLKESSPATRIAPWQRGSNEKHGFAAQYSSPKGTDLSRHPYDLMRRPGTQYHATANPSDGDPC